MKITKFLKKLFNVFLNPFIGSKSTLDITCRDIVQDTEELSFVGSNKTMATTINVPEHEYTERENSVVDILKKISINLKSFVNVGFHDWQDPRRHWWIKICDKNYIDWKIVEVYKPNVIDAIKKGCPKHKILNLNILNVEDLPEADCLLFWHGPEHIKKDIFLSKLKLLEDKYKLLIFGMPLGEEPQGDAYGNPFERHVSAWDTEEWKNLGYEVIEVHDGRLHAHITAYKIQQSTDTQK